jgi:hypothetical protein
MKLDILKNNDTVNFHDNISRSALSTVGLRRATEAKTIKMTNMTGLDLNVQHNLAPAGRNSVLVAGNTEVVLGHVAEEQTHYQYTMSVGIASTSTALIGARQPLADIPISSASLGDFRLYVLYPASSELGKKIEIQMASHNVEPVVESCIRNERLKPSISDVFGLSKGKDLLSSEVWPLDEDNTESFLSEVSGKEVGENLLYGQKTRQSDPGNWIKPYLKSDPPEWSDMTGSQVETRNVRKQRCAFETFLGFDALIVFRSSPVVNSNSSCQTNVGFGWTIGLLI